MHFSRSNLSKRYLTSHFCVRFNIGNELARIKSLGFLDIFCKRDFRGKEGRVGIKVGHTKSFDFIEPN